MAWAQFVPMLLRLPWDGQHRKTSALLWLVTLVLLPIVHRVAQLLIEYFPSDVMAAAFFGFAGMFAVNEALIFGWTHPVLESLLVILAAVEFWGCAGMLLQWPGFESSTQTLLDRSNSFSRYR